VCIKLVRRVSHAAMGCAAKERRCARLDAMLDLCPARADGPGRT